MPQKESLGKLRSYKLTSSVAAVLLAFSSYGALLTAEGRSWTLFFDAQSSSVIFFSVVFLGVAIILARRNVSDVEVFSIALATTISAIWFYELIYHYSFITYFNYFRYPYFDFNDTRTLLSEGALSLLVLVGYKHQRVRQNYYFGGLITAFATIYSGWLLIGFPQLDGTFQLPRFIQVDDPVFVGYLLNRFSKLFLCLSWVALYFGATKGRKVTLACP
ncbi:MAG: hypothetical protein LYZ66_04685 [Nitrososphaerales archaeon]|nr:hypothetical protein [Nitrososphaerales archaeon]